MQFSILVVEDDDDIRAMIIETLMQPDYKLHSAADGKEALETFRSEEQTDLVILDLMLPKIDGLTVLRRIRDVSIVPVLILSARNGEYEKVLGLEYGADDYLTKPFSVIELQARVRALLRRAKEYQPAVSGSIGGEIAIGDLRIEPDNIVVKKNNKPVNLTAKEFSILKLFAEHPEKVYTKVQLYREIWDENYLNDENVINVNIRRLREKIEDNPSEPKYIKTVWGIGYKLGEFE